MYKLAIKIIRFLILVWRVGWQEAIELTLKRSTLGWLIGHCKYIYFIANHNDQTVKIGISSDPERRFKSLQTGNADDLTLLAIIPGDVQLERALHRRFAHLHIRGEWFHYTGNLTEYIAGLR